MAIEDATPSVSKLIAAHRVQGAAVYNTALEKLGVIEDIMLDKRCGRVAYAVLRFGGFLGFGDRYFPLPWAKLTFSDELEGYIVDIDRATLEGAPSYADHASADWDDEAWHRNVHAHYGVPPLGG
jgi:sporulation protein YlmC with PRC-barrel domain